MKYIRSIGHATKFSCANLNCRTKFKYADISENLYENLQELKDLVDTNF